MKPHPPADAADAPAQRAAVRVDRARLELRHGRPIALQSADEPARWHVLEAIETLTPARLHEWQAMGLPLQALLTAERLQALEGRARRQPMAVPLHPSATLAQLHGVAAVAPHEGEAPVAQCSAALALGDAAPADAAQQGALALAKRARLLPALLWASLPPGAAWQRWIDEAQWLRLSAHDLAGASPRGAALRRVSDARVPIEAAEDCRLVLYREVEGDAEHVAIVIGHPSPDKPVAVRLHSACLTGDLLGSLRCDCGEQLRAATEKLAQEGGVLLYLAQEGRGTGLANKLRAYRLQDAGLDTLQADRHLGFRADERDFGAAAAMLHDLGLRRIRLLTNNPHKIDALRSAGIEVVDRLPLNMPVNGHNRRYIEAKHDLAGHFRADDTPG